MRHAARRDANDAQITEALRRAGFTVMDYGRAGMGIPDKLVVRPLPDGIPWACFVEVKTPTGRLQAVQEAFRAVFQPRGQFYVARDPETAVRDLMEAYTLAIKPEQAR